MTEEINQNKTNLNPSVIEFAKMIESQKANQQLQQTPPQTTSRQQLTPDSKKREEMLQEWNNRPEIKQLNFKAIDLEKFPNPERPSKLSKWWKISIAIALCLIATSIAIFAWIAIKDGTFISPISLICGGMNVTTECSDTICEGNNFTCINMCNATCPAFPSEIVIKSNNT